MAQDTRVTRYEALVEGRDAAARVAATPTSDLYFMVKDVGIDDAHDLIALATPEQVQGFLDLDVWSADQIDADAVRPWLDALIAAGPAQLAHVWRQLDPDLTALVLQRWVRVNNIVEEEVPDWEEPPLIATPDRFFVLKVTSEDDAVRRTVENLVDHLYRADAELARHTIRSASSEPTAELEEMSYRWRTGRLTDLGYAPLDEALEVYRPIDVASVNVGVEAREVAPSERMSLPAVYAEPARRHFLGQALARLQGDDAARLETSLAVLLNRVLAANRVSPSDSVAAAAAAAAGVAALSLGLETVARGDLARATEALRTVPLVRLHRVGHTVTLQLAKLARVLAPRAARAEEPYASLLAALLRHRPQLARALDTPPDLGVRPFASVADVRVATEALAVLAAQITLVRDALGVDPVALGPTTSLGDVGRTALARALLDGTPRFAALSAEEVRRMAAALAGGRLPDPARRTAEAAFAAVLEEKKISTPQEFAAALSGWIGDLERELAGLDTTQLPDPRFVGGLVVQ